MLLALIDSQGPAITTADVAALTTGQVAALTTAQVAALTGPGGGADDGADVRR